MRSVAVCGSKVKDLLPGNAPIANVEIRGVGVTFGLIATKEPAFDADAPANLHHVLLRVKGFSCNYRDLNMIFAAARKGADNSFFPLGSDFVAEVVAVGPGVTSLEVGDRVIADNHYTGRRTGRTPEGVLTNQASKEYQVADECKLIKIPDEMPDRVAAAFSIGAQTTYSMLRKLDLRPGSNVLVTSAKSNTSLSAINALRLYDVNVYATSTSRAFERELREMGVRELIRIDPRRASFLAEEEMVKAVSRVGTFDYVVDPFFDLHLHKAVEVMSPGGRYVTCGLHEQFQQDAGQEGPRPKADLSRVMLLAMIKNLQIVGNCIGTTHDLSRALSDYAGGALRVTLDSVFGGDKVGDFFARTYNARDRFGKVVYLYD